MSFLDTRRLSGRLSLSLLACEPRPASKAWSIPIPGSRAPKQPQAGGSVPIYRNQLQVARVGGLRCGGSDDRSSSGLDAADEDVQRHGDRILGAAHDREPPVGSSCRAFSSHSLTPGVLTLPSPLAITLRRLRLSTSDVPPQSPHTSLCWSACIRHSLRTPQHLHTILAALEAPPRSGQKISGSATSWHLALFAQGGGSSNSTSHDRGGCEKFRK
jgi:hypothetical protein